MKKLFKLIGAELTLLFNGHLPAGWEGTTDALINALEKAKSFTESVGALTVAALLPNGLGTLTLNEVHTIIMDTLPELEIAKGAEDAIKGITDPVAKADAIIEYVVKNINSLPAAWQGKHWLDTAVAILTKILNITTTEANAIINIQLGKMKANA